MANQFRNYLFTINNPEQTDKSKEIPVNKFTGELITKQIKLTELTPIEDNGDCPF